MGPVPFVSFDDDDDRSTWPISKDGRPFNPYGYPHESPMGPAGSFGIMPELGAPTDQMPDLIAAHELEHGRSDLDQHEESQSGQPAKSPETGVALATPQPRQDTASSAPRLQISPSPPPSQLSRPVRRQAGAPSSTTPSESSSDFWDEVKVAGRTTLRLLAPFSTTAATTAALLEAPRKARQAPAGKGNPAAHATPPQPSTKPAKSLNDGSHDIAEYRDLLAKREGRRNDVYLDTKGVPTVGIGHKVLPGEHLKVGDRITDVQIDRYFATDSQTSLSAAKAQAAEAGIDDPDFIRYLASVNFQLGTDWRIKFKNTWKRIVAGRYAEAADEVGHSLWSEQTPVRVADFQGALRRLGAKP